MMNSIMEYQAAYQGIDGAYSQEAIFHYFNKEVKTCGCVTFDEVIQQVEADRAELGFLPVENSVAGTIVQTYDLLLDSNLSILGEYFLPIHHNLMIHPDSPPDEIEVVYSHPQALAQCAQFIKRFNYRAEIVWDTAGSAQKLRKENLLKAAAIASKRAADSYQLNIVASNIEDVQHNTTRFFILGKQTAKAADKNKTSIVLSTRHEPGALVSCLHELSSRDINLTKIESRPNKRNPWHYIFYLDFVGHIGDANVEQALLSLLKKSSFMKILGSYPLGNTNDAS